MKLAYHSVQLPIGSKFDVSTVVVDGVGCADRYVEDVSGAGASVTVSGVPDDVAVGEGLTVTVGVVDVDVVV